MERQWNPLGCSTYLKWEAEEHDINEFSLEWPFQAEEGNEKTEPQLPCPI